MIRVWTFSWLVFQTSCGVLAAEDSVTLKSILVKKPFSVQVAFPIHCDIHQFESSPLPKIIATINEFIDPSIKTSLRRDLSLRQPVKASFQVKFIRLFEKQQSR